MFIEQFQVNYITFNFTMEEKSRAKPSLSDEVEEEAAQKNSLSQPVVQQKALKRSKREVNRQKRRQKGPEKKQPQSAELETESVGTKQKEEDVNSVESNELIQRGKIKNEPNTGSQNVSFQKLLYAPSYINTSEGTVVQGNHGHASIMLKRPVVEGDYFMEFIVRQNVDQGKPIAYPPSVRAGICCANFDVDYPVGCGQSIGIRGKDGQIVYNNKCIGNAEQLSVGDTVGVCMRIAPPKKYSKSEQKLEGSLVQFYKNGALIYTFKELKQVFYCFVVSTFNYSQIQFCYNKKRQQVYKAKHYLECLNEKIAYRDLVANKMFKL